MKLQISQRTLESAVRKAALFAVTKSTLPQLETLLFSANGKLEISATDLETSVVVTVTKAGGYQGVQDGITNIPVALFREFLTGSLEQAAEQAYTKDGVAIVKKDGSFKTKTVDVDNEITAEHDAVTRRFELNVGGKVIARMSCDETTQLPMFTNEFVATAPGFYIESDDLAMIAKKTAAFVSTDQLRPAMMGVQFVYDGTTLTASATDGHHAIRVSILAVAPAPFEFIISADTLRKAAQTLTGPVLIETMQDAGREPHIRLSAHDATGSGATITARFIDERYVQLAHVFAGCENERIITVDRTALRQVLPALTPCINARTTRIEIAVRDAYGRLSIVARREDAIAEMHLACDDNYFGGRGTPISNFLNVRFLNDALQALESETVTFEFKDGTSFKPILIREETDVATIAIIIMPQKPEAEDRSTEVREGNAYVPPIKTQADKDMESVEELWASRVVNGLNPFTGKPNDEPEDDGQKPAEISALEAQNCGADKWAAFCKSAGGFAVGIPT